MLSQCVEAVGLAFAITALITFAVANITPPQAAAIAATIQIARLLGNEIGSAVIQTFVRVREQVYSNLIGLHVVSGLPATEQAIAQLAGPFGSRVNGIGEPAAQGTAVLASIVQPGSLCAGLHRRTLADCLGFAARYRSYPAATLTTT